MTQFSYKLFIIISLYVTFGGGFEVWFRGCGGIGSELASGMGGFAVRIGPGSTISGGMAHSLSAIFDGLKINPIAFSA